MWISSPHVNEAPLSLYLIEGVVSGTVGGLVAPFSASVFVQFPWLPIGSSLVAIVLVLRFALASGPTRDWRPIVNGLIWMFTPVAVVLPIFVIAPDLQGARYLYLPMVGWAVVVVALASLPRAAFGGTARVFARSLVALNIAGTLFHLGPWRAAAGTRDEVLRAAVQDAPGCTFRWSDKSRRFYPG